MKPVNVTKLALQGICPVSYFHGGPHLGDLNHVASFEGATYLFTNTQAKEMFQAAPSQFTPAYGTLLVLR